jgi:8-demethyl-8-alpha-L-rhamnosyltetracenomycin-C 2'-O-methyltransferase
MSDRATMDLSELFNLHGSDKDVGGYTPVYHTLLSARKNEPLTILEIGIGTMLPDVHSSMLRWALPGYRPGGSLRAWRDYFPCAEVHGVDVQPDTQFSESRIMTHLCDSTDPAQVEALFSRLNGLTPDIIIDDGSHVDANQLATLRNFYPHLRQRGLYFLEDLDPGCLLTTDPQLVESVCGNDAFFFAGLQNNLCVIYKSPLAAKRRPYFY